MSPVIKRYLFIPLPVLISDPFSKTIGLRWISGVNPQSKLSASFLNCLKQQTPVHSYLKN